MFFALSRAFDVTGVPGDHLVYIEIGELSETNETPVYATPARESPTRSTITVLRDRHLTLNAASRDGR